MNMPFTNTMGDYSVYQMEGLDKLIIRAKGGPTREQIANDPQFGPVRNSQSEFSGAGKAVHLVFDTFRTIARLADHNLGGMIGKVCRMMQTLDTSNNKGQRSILFTKFGSMIEGMDFSKQKPMESVLKQMPAFNISRNDKKAIVFFTDLFPGINLLNPWNFPKYRFLITLGMVQDMVFTDGGYSVVNDSIILNRSVLFTDWFSSNKVLGATRLELQLLETTVLDINSSLVLSIGVEFGRVISNTVTEPVKKGGCGKILGVS